MPAALRHELQAGGCLGWGYARCDQGNCQPQPAQDQTKKRPKQGFRVGSGNWRAAAGVGLGGWAGWRSAIGHGLFGNLQKLT